MRIVKRTGRLFFCLAAALAAVMLFSCGKTDNKEIDDGSNAVSPDGKFVFEGVSLILPEGFSVKNQEEGKMAADFEKDTGENVMFTKSNDKKSDYTEDELKKLIEKSVGTEAADVEVETLEDGGTEYAKYSFFLDADGGKIKVVGFTFFIDEKDSVTLTFTGKQDVFDGVFAGSIESVGLEK